MTRSIFRFKVQLRQILLTVLVGVTLFISVALQWHNMPQAQAATLTPEAKQYQVNSGNDQVQHDLNQTRDNVEEAGNGVAKSLKQTAETVREKLNLDEPLPEGTRDFFKQIRGEEVQIEEPRPFGK